MKITSEKIGTELVLCLYATKHEEAEEFKKLGRDRAEFKGTFFTDPRYVYPHIELRKEIL